MRTLQPCGTPGAYRRHLNSGQKCQVCLDAVAAQRRAEREQARLQAVAFVARQIAAAREQARLRALAVSDTAGPGPDEVGYEWYREMSLP